MKIKTIGTGALTGKSKSFCTLIDEIILVDCGNGIVKTMIEQNINIGNIEYLLITHMHGDHYFDIPFLIIQRDIIKPTKPLIIFCPKDGKKMIRELTRLAFVDLYDTEEKYNDLINRANVIITEIDEINNYELNPIYTFSALKVIHGELENCFSYIISTNNKKVGISGDSSYCDSIDNMVNEADIAILDMSFEIGNEWHMGLNDIKKILSKYNNKTIIVNHLSSSIRNSLENKKIDKLIVPSDGDEFSV